MANLFDEAPEGQPEFFIAGDYLTFKRSDIVSDYPTADYSAQYVCRGIDQKINEFSISSTKQTTHFLLLRLTQQALQLRLEIMHGSLRLQEILTAREL
jgi:hypothetical protein